MPECYENRASGGRGPAKLPSVSADAWCVGEIGRRLEKGFPAEGRRKIGPSPGRYASFFFFLLWYARRLLAYQSKKKKKEAYRPVRARARAHWLVGGWWLAGDLGAPSPVPLYWKLRSDRPRTGIMQDKHCFSHWLGPRPTTWRFRS